MLTYFILKFLQFLKIEKYIYQIWYQIKLRVNVFKNVDISLPKNKGETSRSEKSRQETS